MRRAPRGSAPSGGEGREQTRRRSRARHASSALERSTRVTTEDTPRVAHMSPPSALCAPAPSRWAPRRKGDDPPAPADGLPGRPFAGWVEAIPSEGGSHLLEGWGNSSGAGGNASGGRKPLAARLFPKHVSAETMIARPVTTTPRPWEALGRAEKRPISSGTGSAGAGGGSGTPDLAERGSPAAERGSRLSAVGRPAERGERRADVRLRFVERSRSPCP